MKTVKTSELTGAALDWAVAKCEWILEHIELEQVNGCWSVFAPEHECSFEPSICWTQGGPIIERERIGIWPSDSIEDMWAARPDYKVYPERLPPFYGPTPLIAAMRCLVASKMGDTVEIPEDLQ